jgi:hypothetical protein
MTVVRSDPDVLLLAGRDVADLLLVARYALDRATVGSELADVAARLRGAARAHGVGLLDPQGGPVGQ